MNVDSTGGRPRQPPDLTAGIRKRMLQILLTIAFQSVILFLAAGRFDWWQAWVYIAMYLVGVLINGAIMLRHSPEIIAERAETRGMKDWDKTVSSLWAVMYFILILLIAGLDARFGWTGQIGLVIWGAAILAFMLGGGLFSWAMISNAYFSTVVRIQKDRGHAVCTTGPYQYVRHPGYVGAVIQSLSAPLLLGSLWALIPGGLAAVLIIVRTALEDRTLHGELVGYREYAASVRYRLLPGVW